MVSLRHRRLIDFKLWPLISTLSPQRTFYPLLHEINSVVLHVIYYTLCLALMVNQEPDISSSASMLQLGEINVFALFFIVTALMCPGKLVFI